jgi:hypothetical protein
MKLSSRLSCRHAIVALAFASFCFAQKDPGVRGGPPGAGGPLPKAMRPAAALQAAQVAMGRNDRRWTAPYYWAGFVLQSERR